MRPPLDKERIKLLKKAFKMPTPQTPASRKTSITNAFVSAIIPCVQPQPDEIDEALSILGIDPANMTCAYCGDRKNGWDHLRPLVVDRRPTGYISEIANLVPSCNSCNSSKGNKYWHDWMHGNAGLSPMGRGVHAAIRAERLHAYEKWRTPMKIDFSRILSPAEWNAYWALCEQVIDDMKKCQEVADSILDRAKRSIRRAAD